MESKELELLAAEDLTAEHTDCVICFEALESRGGAIPLPCDCRVPYCAECWDRALAASISACGRALCPSCRGAMRVDYDASLGHLTFSRLSASESSNASENDWRRRLYEQAKPKQIQLLQRFGAQRPRSTQSGVADGTSRTSAVEENAQAEPDPPEVLAHVAAAGVALQPARCVCGCSLAEVSVRDRVLTFVQEESPFTPPRSVVKRLMLSPPIVCDICCRRVQPSSKVWTCENGRRTVLHAAAYDVCESCFVFHAYGIEDLPCDEEYRSDVDDDYAGGAGSSSDGEVSD